MNNHRPLSDRVLAALDLVAIGLAIGVVFGLAVLAGHGIPTSVF